MAYARRKKFTLSLAETISIAVRLPRQTAKRIERVLTTDPGMGLVRHVDAGYTEAIEFAEKNDVKIPMTITERHRNCLEIIA